MATGPSDNLPVLAVRTGGALVKVMSELEQHATKPLSRLVTAAISRTVAENPELNTEARVSMLVDLASFHGEEIGSWLASVCEQYDVEVVYLAVDYLYEAGHSDRSDVSSDERRESLRNDIEELCELIIRLQAVVNRELSVQDLHVYVLRVGLAGASSMDDDLLVSTISDETDEASDDEDDESGDSGD